MKAIHRKRLQKLADFLKTVPPKQFDIDCLFIGDRDKLGCGSIACAIGHCPIAFPSDWEFNPNPNFYSFEAVRLKCGSDGFWDEDAKRYFGISEDDVKGIFLSSGYRKAGNVTPKMVARKIERLLRDEAKAAAK